MNSHVSLIRMDSTSYTCCYGNDVYSYQVRCPQNAIIFFPGDIQDAETKMNESTFARNYIEFSYEKTLQILHNKYIDSNIFIIRPSLKPEEISMYKKYLNCDKNGNITNYNPNGNATHTLFVLLEDYLCGDHEQLPLILMGFSRGGLVLNQLISEIGYTVYSHPIFSRIQEIHWLDCGNGLKDLCYPVLSPTSLSGIKQLQKPIRCYFHLTSYLYSESSSCSNYSQLQQLCSQLQIAGLFVSYRFYQSEFDKYGSLDPLHQHFSLLHEFHYWICLLE